MTHGAPSVLTAKGQHTRERIVQAAAVLVLERGVGQTTIGDVKDAAQVSSSQLYHYFEGKNDLIAAVIAHHTDNVVGRTEAEFSDIDGIDGFRAWRDAVVDAQRRRGFRHGCPIGSLASALVDTDPDARADLSASVTRWQAVIRQGLTRMRDRGLLAPTFDVDALSIAFVSALQGGLLLSKVSRSSVALEASLDAMLRLLELEVANNRAAT